ncbi:MAG: hypothetical protein KTR35_18380 [Gammaproteobacteria bacterium]|nr:hypothetical protein [Gammaproteobacteria bacterium]
MKVKQHYQVTTLLLLSAILLASLIPGGPIENRDFSHIHTGILAGFNIFLTALNLGTFALTYFVIKQHPWSRTAVFFTAISYFTVYAIDLAQLFPRSPTPMSQALSVVEVLGLCTAVLLMFLSTTSTRFDQREGVQKSARVIVTKTPPHPHKGVSVLALTFVIALGIGIIAFATDSAMSPAVNAEFLSK